MTSIHVQFKGETSSLELATDATLATLQQHIETQLGVQLDAQRLFQKRRRVDTSDGNKLVSQLCDVSQPLMLMAGASKQKIDDMKTTQQSVQKEMQIRENRHVVDIIKKNQAFEAREAVSTQFRFHGIEPLKQFKDSDKAREILERLANDRGILAVMAKHKWTVGVLAEMPPDGKVGVDPVCVLGLNQNKGQKILLRLRTDDLLGFRKFLSIKKVLFHELSHNVHSEHDNKFYQLMRQVEKECNELDWTSSHGASVGGARAAHYDNMEASRSTGHRLGGGSAGTSRLLDAVPVPQIEHVEMKAEPVSTEKTHSSNASDEDVARATKADSGSKDVDMEDADAENELSAPSIEKDPVPAAVRAEVDQHVTTVDEEVATLAMSDRERRIHDAVRHLQSHYAADAIAKAVSLLHKIISNIITHPADAKFRSIRKSNRLFEGQVARFPECLEFLLALGFEDQSDKFVLVREDPALLWIGRSTLEILLPVAA